MLNLSNISVKYKLWSLIVFSAIGLVALMIHALQDLNANLLHDRKVKAQDVVDIAYGIIEYQAKQAEQGIVDEATAKRSAIAQIKSLRYENNDYFWINDYQPKMIMHPTKPELDGKDLSNIADPKGIKLFVEFADIVKQQGSGYVTYMWPKPDSDDPVEKLSYVKGFEKWQWIVGTGIYIDDMNKVFWAEVRTDLAFIFVTLAIMIAASLYIIKDITSGIRKVHDAMEQVEQTGNLNAEVDATRQDEIGEIAVAFNKMLTKFRTVISDVRQMFDNLNGSSNSLATVANQTVRDVMEQQSKTDQVATAINQMSATVQEVARSAEAASHSANQANDSAMNGHDVVQSTINAINSLADEVISSSDVIAKLESNSDDIGRVLDVIKGIAEQTNLLALNAAIEAARAGEQGRGFAVVADEVRTLAQRTQESTQEIQSMIEALQAGARNAGEAMQSSRTRAESCTQQAAEANDSLQSILSAVKEINELNAQIASASEQQSAVAEDINKNVVGISQIATQSSANSQETASTCDAINNMVQTLESQLSQFRA